MSKRSPVRPATTSQWLFEELRQGIVSGVYPAGTAIRQEEIAENYGVSRMPVREAMRMLESSRLVINQPHRGLVVTELSVADVEELYYVRASLECAAIRRSFVRMTDEQLAFVETSHQHLCKAKPDQVIEFHRQFHLSLYAAAGARLLELINEQLIASERYHLRFGRHTLLNTPADEQDHSDLAKAAASRDAAAAEDIMRKHLHLGVLEIIGSIEEHSKRPEKERP